MWTQRFGLRSTQLISHNLPRPVAGNVFLQRFFSAPGYQNTAQEIENEDVQIGEDESENHGSMQEKTQNLLKDFLSAIEEQRKIKEATLKKYGVSFETTLEAIFFLK